MSEGVKAADLSLAILETVAFSPEPLGGSQIAAIVGIAKSAVFKHTQTLVERGYLVQDAVSLRYKLGPKAWLLSKLAPAVDDIAAIAEPLMRDARSATGLAVVLSTSTPKGVFVLATFTGTGSIEIGVRPGSELELHASAQGKIFLAYGPKSMSDHLARKELQPLTSHTITSLEVLMDEIGEIRKRGYATAPEQTLLGVNTIAAPVYNYMDKLVASVGLVGSIQHLPSEVEPAMIETMLNLASDISKAMGNGLPYRGADTVLQR